MAIRVRVTDTPGLAVIPGQAMVVPQAEPAANPAARPLPEHTDPASAIYMVVTIPAGKIKCRFGFLYS